MMKKKAILLFACAVLLAGPACRAVNVGPLQRPTETTAPVRATPIPSASSPQVMDACPVREQTSPLRPDMPAADLTSLGLDACYELTFDFTSGGPEYLGTARIHFTNLTGQALDEIVLRLYPNATSIFGGSLVLEETRLDGAAVEPEIFLRDETAARLPLKPALPPGASLLIELNFRGVLPDDLASDNAYGLFQWVSEGPVVSAASAYPILAEWEDGSWQAGEVIPAGDAVVSRVALYDVTIQTPAGWQVAASGTLVDEQDLGGSVQALRFASGPVREFMLAASPIFIRQQVSAGGVELVHWGLPGTEEDTEGVLEVAAESLETFTRFFGPYPYRELDLVSLPLRYASGVEYPGVVLLEASLYDRGFQSIGWLPVVVSHEVAHQWWYGVVGSDILESPWQDEALASFSALLYQQEYEIAAYRATLAGYRAVVQNYEEDNGPEAVGQPLEAFSNRADAYSTIVYVKGTLFFVELREEIGSDAFYRGLQTYYGENQYQNAQPEDLLSAFEEACGCSLDSFYQEWGVSSPGG